MILGIGTPLEIIAAIAIYMVATVLVTELFKKVIPVDGGLALLFSWCVGISVFVVLALVKFFAFSIQTILLFVVITGFVNKIYQWERLKKFIRKVLKTDV